MLRDTAGDKSAERFAQTHLKDYTSYLVYTVCKTYITNTTSGISQQEPRPTARLNARVADASAFIAVVVGFVPCGHEEIELIPDILCDDWLTTGNTP